MSGKPSRVRQREVRQVIRAAQQAGVKEVVVRIGEASITIPTGASEDANAAEVITTNAWPVGDCNHSFDKIMRDK
ncbi:MAG TPA: hypothetical protein VEI98_04225 [Xanthobacteraceae bacterium]|nr:hypothetical protein [Xanthobacteraceae bacterium]